MSSTCIQTMFDPKLLSAQNISKASPKIFVIFWSLFLLLVQSQYIITVHEAGAQQSPSLSNFVTYNGSKLGITIQYPEDWVKEEDPSGIWFVSPVNESGNVGLESQPSQNVSLTDLVQFQLLNSKESYKDFKIVSSNMSMIDGNPANRTDYKFKVEVPKFLGADVYDYDAIKISTIKGDKLITLTYFSDPENFYLFLPLFQKMISTLKIT